MKFGNDKWCSDSSLREPFLFLYSIVVIEDAWMFDVWDQQSEGGHWNCSFLRNMIDWEMERLKPSFQGFKGRL